MRFLLLSLFFLLAAASAQAQTPTPAVAPWMEDETRAAPITPVAPPPSATPQKTQDAFSPLEQSYQARVIDPLEQFGYDMFGAPSEETQEKLDSLAAMPLGAVQEDFILNSGDEVEVVFSGQRADRATYKIDSRGMILIPDFPPIPAAGRTMGQVRLSIETAARNMHNTQAYVSLSGVRQIGALVVGHVRKPGRQTLTVFHTVLDALMAAGGVDKTGSLRQIKLIRDGRATIVDLYGLLIYGSANMDLRLRDGDRIIVPPLGPTVAVAGGVKRPGIYEVQPALKGMRHDPAGASEKLSLNEMLELGGGLLTPGQTRYMRLDLTRDGYEEVTETLEPFAPVFSDGAILMVSKGQEKRAGMIELAGNTRRPGMHALDEEPTLAKLLDNEQALGKDIYPLIGVIERWDDKHLTTALSSFPLLLVLKGEYDQRLQDGDVVHLFSNAQVKNLDKARETKTEEGSADVPDDKLDPKIVSFLKERSVFVRGAVRENGAYPVAEGATLDSLLAASGGLTLEANTSNVEVTSALLGEGGQKDGRSGTRRLAVDIRETNPADVPVEAGDSVRVNQKFQKVEDKSVLIIGEVANPGRYDLIAGDKISDLLRRAGGLTEDAYPQGAVFSRENERKAEETRFRAAARDMERAIATALEKDPKEGPSADQIRMAKDLAGELREAQALGRITVEADPAALATTPELDMLLEPGDRLYIPKRPLTVRVSGEVLSPASLQFRSGKDPLAYIEEAGGFTYYADSDRAFVLYPDGSAQPLQVSSWNHKAAFIPPGSTIVVPRDPKPFDFIESAKDISQILSNLAVTAIFVDDVRDDD